MKNNMKILNYIYRYYQLTAAHFRRGKHRTTRWIVWIVRSLSTRDTCDHSHNKCYNIWKKTSTNLYCWVLYTFISQKKFLKQNYSITIRSDSLSSGGSADDNWSPPSPPLPLIETKKLVTTIGSAPHLEKIEHCNNLHYHKDHHGARLPKLPSFHGISIGKYIPNREKQRMYT